MGKLYFPAWELMAYVTALALLGWFRVRAQVLKRALGREASATSASVAA